MEEAAGTVHGEPSGLLDGIGGEIFVIVAVLGDADGAGNAQILEAGFFADFAEGTLLGCFVLFYMAFGEVPFVETIDQREVIAINDRDDVVRAIGFRVWRCLVWGECADGAAL